MPNSSWDTQDEHEAQHYTPDHNDTEATVKSSLAPDAPRPAVPPAPPAPLTTAQPGMIPPPPPPNAIRDSAARDRLRQRKVNARGNRGGEWAWVVIAVALVGVVVIISAVLALVLRSAFSGEQEVVPTAVAALPTPVDGRISFSGDGIAEGETIVLDDGRSIVLEPWDGSSRWTILLMGLDRRPGETGLTYRTDTMILVSVDPITQQIGMLSIPRDLYVEVPNYNQLQRVNTPMVLGELQQPGSGPALAMQTVQYNLGIRVHDYVLVDFQAVIGLIDLIGGIEIDVPYGISDPRYPSMNYGYDPFYISAGLQQLDGATALKYARTRHGDSDFRRAERQQAVIQAVRDKILQFDMLPQLIASAPSLLRTFENNFYTSMSIDQMIQLAWYLKDIPPDNLSTGVISQQYVIGHMTSQGASVLIPNRNTIGPLMVEVFGANYAE